MCNDLLDESSAIDMVLNAFFMGNYEIKHFYSMKIARGPLSVEITNTVIEGEDGPIH